MHFTLDQEQEKDFHFPAYVLSQICKNEDSWHMI
jgi:hypothetical protein